MSSGTGDRRNYEDLKAKLGLKKTSPAPEDLPAAASTTATPGAKAEAAPSADHTPAGGFDLGLERGSTGVLRDEDHGKAAPAYSGGGPEVTLKVNVGTVVVKGVLLIAALAAAGVSGYILGRSLYDREIAARQKKDAATIKQKLGEAQVMRDGKPVPLAQVVSDHIDIIQRVGKRVDEARNAPGAVATPEMLKAVRKELEELQQACATYREMAPRIDIASMLADNIFNREAVKETMKLSEALERLFSASELMAQEKIVFQQFQQALDVSKLDAPSQMHTWRWVELSKPDAEGRPRAFLVDVTYVKDKDGKVEFKKEPLPQPAGAPPLAPGQEAPFKWLVHIKYDDPSKVGGLKEDWVPPDFTVQWDLKRDVTEAAKQLASIQQEGYELMMLARLFERVDVLKAAADPVAAIRTKTLETLTKLGGE